MSSISLSYTTSSDTATSIVVTWSVYFNNSNGSWSNDPCSGAITFNGSTKSFSATFTSSSKTVGSASFTVTKPKTSSAQSYSCSAWFNAAGTSSGYMSTSSSISIDPKWHYSVAYNKNSGSGSMSASTKWYNETLTLTNNAFTKSGYVFQGWATSAGGSVAYANKANYTSNSGTTLYAQWKKDITLSFDANTGSGEPSSETKSVWNSTTSATFTIPTTVPTKQYYKFTKWNTKADGSGTDYSAGAQYSFSSSTILYAQWVEDYIPPQYGAVDVHRTNSSGSTNDGTGSYGKLTFTWTNGSLSGTTFNTTATAKYQEHGASSWTTITNGSSTANTFSAVFGGGALSADKQYNIQITLQDTGYPANTYLAFISTELFTIDVNADGTAVSFLEPAPDDDSGVFAPPMTEAELNAFLDSLNRNFRGSVDWIVEEGTDGIWTYRKWDSGIAECWGHKTGSTAFTRTWAGLTICDAVNVSFPTDLFIETPCVTFANSGSSAVVFNGGDITQYQVPIQMGRGATATTATYNVSIVAKGRWK